MELSDVQGLVFYGYKHQPLSRFYLVTFAQESEPRAWLSRLMHRVSSADSAERTDPTRLNVAFTATGLERLGLDEESLFTFPREFTQGMAHPERSIALGDYGDNAPEHWEYGGAKGPRIDALVLLYCATATELEERHSELVEQMGKYRLNCLVQESYLPEDGREHFGFADGLSNPSVQGGPLKYAKNPFDPPIRAGELLLGHKNAYGRLPFSPRAPVKLSTRELPPRVDRGKAVDLGHNGTYLVLRKLEQDVERFWRFAEEQAARAGAEDEHAWSRLFAARLVGRWPNGTPLVTAPTSEHEPHDDLNYFGYRAEDAQGLRCPLGAHIRRSNPRDALGDDGQDSLLRSSRHRIMRRGRLYAGEAGRCGLVFIALNSNLRRQFEFIQQTWINNPKFAGLCHDRDPIIGRDGFDVDDKVVPRIFTRAFTPVRDRCVGMPSFVRTRGGGYFFMPSLRALSYLAEG